MKVDLTNFGVEPPDQNKPGRAGQAAGSSSGAASRAPDSTSASAASSNSAIVDQIRFSFDPTRVQSLQAQVLAQPEVHADKVKALRQAIDNGEYSVPPSHVAGALIGDLVLGA